jgi:methyl-accepting chemotaxis protein
VRLTIKTKLLGSAALLLVFLAAIGLLSIRNLGSVNKLATSMYADRVVPINQLGIIDSALVDMQRLNLRGLLNKDKPDVQKEVDADIAAVAGVIDKTSQAYAATFLLPSEKTNLAAFQKSYASYQATRDKVRSLVRAGKAADGAALNNTVLLPQYKAANGAVEALSKINVDEAKRLSGEIASTYKSSRTLTLAFLLAAILLGGAISWWIARAIVNAIKRMVATAEAVGGGDLTSDLDTSARDEMGDMARAFQAMVEKLRTTISTVTSSADQLGSASQEMASTSEEAGKAVGEIASAVGDVAQGAERQVRMVETARGLTEEISAAVNASATDAQETAKAARETLAVSEEGAGAALKATDAMQAVRDSSGAVTEAIRQLGAKSEQIGGIVETITGIAGQTNLLALNAAIEAARAGEQGRGFAVVAEEVRKLAEESQQAAASIAQLIEEIQAETRKAVDVVEDGAKRTEDGAAVVEQTREAFTAIGERVEDMTTRVEQIAASIQQVASSAVKVQESMSEVAALAEQSSASSEQVSASTEETSASTQQIAASAEELASTAEELNRLVGQFKLVA